MHKAQNPVRHTMPAERVLNQYQNQAKPSEEAWEGMDMFQSRHNINKFTSKLKSMVTDLNQTVAGEIDKNNKLNQNINQLRKALDMEKKRTVDVDQRLRDEFKEYKKNENEKIEHHERLSNRLNEIKIEIGREGLTEAQLEESKMVLKGDLAKLESENELLKNELKRLSKLTTEKILGGLTRPGEQHQRHWNAQGARGGQLPDGKEQGDYQPRLHSGANEDAVQRPDQEVRDRNSDARGREERNHD